MKPLVLIDVDDTFIDNTRVTKEHLKAVTGVEDYDMNLVKDYKFTHLSHSEREKLYELFESDLMYKYCNVVDNSVEEINKIKEYADVLFVTASNVFHAKKRFEQLKLVFPDIQKHDIIHTGKKHIIAGSVIIDDNANNVITSMCPIKMLVTRCWNTNINVDDYEGMYRIDKWSGVSDRVYNALLERGLIK